MKNSKEIPYFFSYQDDSGNEIESKIIECSSKKEATNIAFNILGNMSHNDITQIKTKKQCLLK